jgi:hypothetical protein
VNAVELVDPIILVPAGILPPVISIPTTGTVPPVLVIAVPLMYPVHVVHGSTTPSMYGGSDLSSA